MKKIFISMLKDFNKVINKASAEIFYVYRKGLKGTTLFQMMLLRKALLCLFYEMYKSLLPKRWLE